MYHIVFNSDEKYLSYVAVLITSIVKNTESQINKAFINNIELLDELSQDESYTFHIFIDSISEISRANFVKLENELNCFFATKILIHIVDDSYFKKNKMVQLGGNYSTYFRLKIASIIPKHVLKCLYLDVDMLVLSDIRDIFKYKLENRLIGVVNVLQNSWPPLISKVDSKEFKLEGMHFNSGMMLINLNKWRNEHVEKYILDLSVKYYIPYAPDEYILNAFISKEDILVLPLQWNFLIGFKILYHKNKLFYSDSFHSAAISYKLNEFEKAVKKIKILHYTYLYMPKPWENVYGFIDDDYNLVYYEFYDTWWDMALKTPIYGEHFAKKKREYEKKSLLTYAQAMSKKIKALEKKTIENNVFMKECLTNGACDRVKNHLNYKIGRVLIDNFTVLKILLIPFKLIYVIMIHKISSFIYKILMQNNPSLKLLPLEKYADYEEAMRIKSFFSYRLGKLFLKNPLSFLFKIKTIKKRNK